MGDTGRDRLRTRSKGSGVCSNENRSYPFQLLACSVSITVVVNLYVVLPPAASGGVASMTCTESQHPDFTKRPAPISVKCKQKKVVGRVATRARSTTKSDPSCGSKDNRKT